MNLRRFRMLQRVVEEMGIEPDRLRLEWISASEGEKLKTVTNDMIAKIKALGPLGLPKRFEDWDQEIAELEKQMTQEEKEVTSDV